MSELATSERFPGFMNAVELPTTHSTPGTYDERADSITSGRPYQTRLDPPPADPRVAHPRSLHEKADETLASVDGE